MGRWSVAYNAKLGWRKTGRYWMPPIVEFHLHLSLPLLLFDFQPPDPPACPNRAYVPLGVFLSQSALARKEP